MIKITYTSRLRVYTKAILLLPLLILTVSCEGLLEVDTPPASVLKSQVFSDDLTAEAAIRGIYSDMMVSQGNNGFQIAWRAGLSADELTHFNTYSNIISFEENNLLADNSYVSQLWVYAYRDIYRANDVLEGIAASLEMSNDAKKHFKGEALFLRSFYYFYLVNFFGDVPMVTTTDYKTNSNIMRTPVKTIYNQIEADLQEAIELLPPTYPTPGRFRANKAVASSLLARVYLYQGKWADAESTATTILENTTDYKLTFLSGITLPDNKEAIWQICNIDNNPFTLEGGYFYGGTGSIGSIFGYNALRDDFVGKSTIPGAFEQGDTRKTEWLHLNRRKVWMSYKYRSYRSMATTNPDDSRQENSTVFRLAEQYLIRAEARAQQNKLALAIADVDAIRARAGLTLIANTNPGISKPDLLDAIMQERRVELFTEWGHRWFDLKRTGNAVSVLGGIKPGFSSNDLLYPIPVSELNKNPFLEQNPGY